jgi:hypothetical protein
MRVFKSKRVFLLCLAISCVTPAIALADPIRVTGGTVTVHFSDLGGASLTGDGLSLNGDGITDGSGPIQVGSVGRLDGNFQFLPQQTFFHVIVDGTPYDALLDGRLTFTTTPFITPPPTGDSGIFHTTFAMADTSGAWDLGQKAPGRRCSTSRLKVRARQREGKRFVAARITL